LNEVFGTKAKLIPSKGGAYEIEVNGKRIFSKLELGRFPDDGEIAQSIRNLS
jgi:selenoprotein W-related protein